MTDEKECFFISPIGEEGNDERERSDKVMEYIIQEALADYNYTVTRADRMDEPGSITNQVIQKTTDCELVIADLTGHNPNVFYELAVRHATGDPYIQIIDEAEPIPFDISDFRTVKYGLDVEKADAAVDEISEQVRLLEEGDQSFDNPISQSAEMQSLLTSDDPEEQHLAQMIEKVSRIDRKLDQIKSNRSNQVNLSDLNKNTTFTDFSDTESEKQEFVINDRYYLVGDPVTHSELRMVSEQENVTFDEILNRAENQDMNVIIH